MGAKLVLNKPQMVGSSQSDGVLRWKVGFVGGDAESSGFGSCGEMESVWHCLEEPQNVLLGPRTLGRETRGTCAKKGASIWELRSRVSLPGWSLLVTNTEGRRRRPPRHL